MFTATEGYRSFYSGHVAMAVTALSTMAFTVSERYGKTAWPWLLTFGLGSAIGVGRIAAGNHFITDVLVGMAAGTAVGVGIPWLHRNTGAMVWLGWHYR